MTSEAINCIRTIIPEYKLSRIHRWFAKVARRGTMRNKSSDEILFEVWKEISSKDKTTVDS
jgi:hypothetical protein